MPGGKTLKVRLFMEGIEIPCYRVMVQSSIGAPAVASVEIPPAEEFFDRQEESPAGSGNFVQKLGVQPRSLVHIFYEDSDDPDGLPRLLFEGEFVSFEYSKRSDGNGERVLRVMARDVSNILSSIYVRYYSDIFTPYNSLMSIFSGQATLDKPNTETIRLAVIGMGTGLNPEILGAIQNDTGGFGISAAFKDIVTKALSINTFFSGFDARTKISSKIVSLPDTTSKTLLDATALSALVQQNMSNLKESATVWDLYTMLMGMVFYFPTPIAAAPYLPEPVTGVGSVEKGSQTFIASQGKTLMSLLLKPYTWWSAPPTFNVIFPNQYKSFTSRRNFLSEPTRLLMSAFGAIESVAEQQLKTFAPSQFMFVAPRALLDRFDREAYDTQFSDIVNSPSVKASEVKIANLTEQKRQAEIKTFVRNLPVDQKNAAKQQVASLQQQINQEEATLVKLVDQIRAKRNIQLAKDAQRPSRDVRAQLWNRSVLTGDDDVALASREDFKGIVFAFDYMTQSQVEFTKSKNVSPTALKDYLGNIADYKLAIQQHKDRISEMTLQFSPQLVVGFPALVIDPVRNHFGELDVVTHIIDAQGLADTQVQLSFVRNDDVEFSELSRSIPGKIQFPQWINPLYLPSNIGTEVYQKLFPKNKSDSSKPGIRAADSIMAFAPANSKSSQIGAASRIRQLYFAAKDQQRFVSGFTQRNIASMDQVFLQVLGATKNGASYIFSSFSDERYQAVLKYASAANQVRTAIPIDTAQGVKQ